LTECETTAQPRSCIEEIMLEEASGWSVSVKIMMVYGEEGIR
jgi:hypothetical protein